MRMGGKSWLNLKWVERQPMKVKILVGVLILGFCLVGLRHLMKYDNGFPLFMASQFIHLSGIIILIFKLIKTKTCSGTSIFSSASYFDLNFNYLIAVNLLTSGLSLKSQELTAIVMATRTYCSFEVEEHALTLLGSAIFLSTLWVIYMIRFKLKPTYSKELDSMPLYSMVVPPAILAVLIHPHIDHRFLIRIVWSFSLYLAAVSVLPQLRLMQNAKMVEPFTAYYVFALGVARFLNCSSWIIHIYETGGRYLMFSGNWTQLWVLMVILSEFVHTFILADFCYYYLKSVMYQQLLLELSSSSYSLGRGKNI
ncbi:ER lumen protein-retaining receptor 1-B [Vitis vinifera]|uniref:ER lumen protein-retaining receptor 1-B n=1 Tax=Vitis vinifera TaxID=29760 RepID=A0A438IST9_VITVI|nr:ER lumen protein-retaining receptor 1-B [Vitis vinifera]